jgi:hypothetical protein
MSYVILPYTITRAKRLGVIIRPSLKKGKKIDVFTPDGEFICSIGALGYGDYPHFIETHGQEYADKKRRNYKRRHEKDRHEVGSRGWFADYLLW